MFWMDEPLAITICERFCEIGDLLANFLKRHTAIYIKCDPEIVDFRKDYEGQITLHGGNGESIQFHVPKEHFVSFVGILTVGLFGKDKILFTWDVKKLFSYLYYRLDRKYIIDVNAQIIDIKYGEAFYGKENKRPTSFNEAKQKISLLIKNDYFKNIHRRIHIPLATRTLPKIETFGMLDVESRQVRYSVYDIEGETNGRLRCGQPFKDAILSHTLTYEQKAKLKPRQDHVFVMLDFKACEVYLLQWLSKDERLGKIIASGRDIYSTIYSLLYECKCTKDNRQTIKNAFLPIVYGMQSESLAERIHVTRSEAECLIKNINLFFSTAMGWVRDAQERAKQSEVSDYFGRTRKYTDNYHAARNAVVQGPAAIVCSEKLIDLKDRLVNHCEIVVSIHDAYLLSVPKKMIYEVAYIAEEELQKESIMCPGLKLHVDITSGNDLANMTEFNL